MHVLIDQFLNLDVMLRALPLVLTGLWMTVKLCAAVIVLGLAGGLILALGCMSPKRWIRWPSLAFNDVFRAMPPLVLLIFVYSGLPFAGINLSPYAAVVVSFFLNNSSYFAEIYRAGIESVSKGQTEAARSTGLGKVQTLTYIVLPQAVRNVLPDLLSNIIEVIKLTSLASVVSLGEMLYAANMARSLTYNISPLVLAAVLYLLFLWPMVRLVGRFQHSLNV